MQRDDGGGGIIGTPLEALSNDSRRQMTSAAGGRSSSAVRRRPKAGDRLAPPVAQYVYERSRARLNAERDALRDVYVAPDAHPRANSPLVDSEDRAHALALRSAHGVLRHHHAAADAPEIVPLPRPVSVGHAILRAQGLTHTASGLDAQLRNMYNLGELLAAVGRPSCERRSGPGYDEALAEESGAVWSRADDRQRVALQPLDSLSALGDGGYERQKRERGVRLVSPWSGDWTRDDVLDDDDDDDDVGVDGLEDGGVYGLGKTGYLSAAVSRMKAALEREKGLDRHGDASTRPDRTESKGYSASGSSQHEEYCDSGRFRDISKLFTEDDAFDADMFKCLDSAASQADVSVLERFGPHDSSPRHHFEADPFKGTGTSTYDDVVKESLVRVAQRERVELAEIGQRIAARSDLKAVRQHALRMRVRAGAGEGLRSSFVPAMSRGENIARRHTEGPSNALRVGDKARVEYSWTPEAIVCKRFGVSVPPVTHDLPSEDGSAEYQRHADRWKRATGLSSDVEDFLDGNDSAGLADVDAPRSMRGRVDDAGTIRITSVVSRDGQVAVVGDDNGEGTVDALMVIGNSSDLDDDPTDAPARSGSGVEHPIRPLEELSSGGTSQRDVEVARRHLRAAVFGSANRSGIRDSVVRSASGAQAERVELDASVAHRDLESGEGEEKKSTSPRLQRKPLPTEEDWSTENRSLRRGGGRRGAHPWRAADFFEEYEAL